MFRKETITLTESSLHYPWENGCTSNVLKRSQRGLGFPRFRVLPPSLDDPGFTLSLQRTLGGLLELSGVPGSSVSGTTGTGRVRSLVVRRQSSVFVE